SDVGELAVALAALGGPHTKISAQRTVSVLRAAGMSSSLSASAEGQAAVGAQPASAGTGVSWGGTGATSGAQRPQRRVTIAVVALGVLGAAGPAVFVAVRTPVAAPQAASIAVSMPSVDRPIASAPAAAAEPPKTSAPEAPASETAPPPAASAAQASR